MTSEVDTATPADEEVEVDEFEAAFNEEAEKRDIVPDEELPDDLPDIDNVDDAAAAAAATNTPGADDKPVVDEFEGWPQEAKDRYQSQLDQNTQLQHRLDSDSGRVRAFQNKVDGLEDQIKTIQAGGKGDQPTTEEIADAMKGGDEDWASFSEDYPEVAAAIDKRFESQQANIDTTLAPVINKQAQDAAAEASEAAEESYGEVAKTFPTWQDEVQKQEYRDWFATQSPGTKALGESDDTRDASLLIGLYDDYRVEQGRPSMRTDPELDTGVTEVTDEVTQRRNRQLEDGTTLPSKAARVETDQEATDGFEDAFNAYAAKKDRQRQ